MSPTPQRFSCWAVDGGRPLPEAQHDGDFPRLPEVVVLVDAGFIAPRLLDLNISDLEVELRGRATVEMLRRDQPQVCLQKNFVEVEHAVRRPREDEQHPSLLVLAERRFAPFPLLTAPAVLPGVSDQTQILNQRGILRPENLDRHAGGVHVDQTERRRIFDKRIENRDRLVVVRRLVQHLPAMLEKSVMQVGGVVHAPVDGQRIPLRLGPFAGCLPPTLLLRGRRGQAKLPGRRAHPHGQNRMLLGCTRRLDVQLGFFEASFKNLPFGKPDAYGASTHDEDGDSRRQRQHDKPSSEPKTAQDSPGRALPDRHLHVTDSYS